MSEKRAVRELAKWVAVTLAVLLGLYGAAYYGMVVAAPWSGTNTVAVYSTERILIFTGPLPPAETGWNSFFAPIHWLDRHIRPHVWEPTP